MHVNESLETLGKKAIELAGSSKCNLERSCWMVVHEYIHGVMPVEYDIREIDESLYLELLQYATSKFEEN